MKKYILSLSALIIAISIVACSPKTQKGTVSAPPPPPKEPIAAPAPPPIKTPGCDMGKQLMETRCVKCHKLHEPTEFSADKWNKILDKMQPKANITDEERTCIYLYVSAH